MTEYELLHTKAKPHFVTHTIFFILLCGPLRYWWCFRLEGKHQPLKRLAVLCNFHNVSKSVAEGSMRELAHWYSTADFRLIQYADLVAASEGPAVGLGESAVLQAAASSKLAQQLLAQGIPTVGGSWKHWGQVKAAGLHFTRHHLMILRTVPEEGGETQLWPCSISGAVEFTPCPWLASAPKVNVLVVCVHTQPATEQSQGLWTITGPHERLLPRVLEGSQIPYHLPLQSNHPQVEFIEVQPLPNPRAAQTETALFPLHSGHA